MIMDPNFIVKVLLSLIVAAALAFAVTPLVKRLAQRVGAMDVPKDERRMHKIPIPRMGGLAIFFAFLIAVLCFAGIDRELRGILLGATIIVVLGILDDILTLNALPKFAVQIVAAVIAVLHGCRIEHFMGFRLATWLSYPVSVIWIVAITNAVNFIDGLDGLAAGVSAIAAGSVSRRYPSTVFVSYSSYFPRYIPSKHTVPVASVVPTAISRALLTFVATTSPL